MKRKELLVLGLANRQASVRLAASVTVTIIGISSLAACGNSRAGGSSGEDDVSVEAAVRMLQSASSRDYDPYASPEEMRRDTQISLVGRVNSVSRGLIDMGPEYSGVILIELTTDERWSGDFKDPVGVMVYWPEDEPIEQIQKGLEPGTRVAFFGDAAPRVPKDSDVTPYEPAAQGLLIEGTDDRLRSVWGESEESQGWEGVDTVAELRSSLDLSGGTD